MAWIIIGMVSQWQLLIRSQNCTILTAYCHLMSANCPEEKCDPPSISDVNCLSGDGVTIMMGWHQAGAAANHRLSPSPWHFHFLGMCHGMLCPFQIVLLFAHSNTYLQKFHFGLSYSNLSRHKKDKGSTREGTSSKGHLTARSARISYPKTT